MEEFKQCFDYENEQDMENYLAHIGEIADDLEIPKEWEELRLFDPDDFSPS